MATRYNITQTVEDGQKVFTAYRQQTGGELEKLGKRSKIRPAQDLCERSAGTKLDWSKDKDDKTVWEATR